MIKDAEN